MWLLDILRAIAFEDDDPLREERKGAGAEISDSEEEEEEITSSSDAPTTTTATTTATTTQGRNIAQSRGSIASTKASMSRPKNNNGFMGSLMGCFQCLGTCCMITYVLCPPFPSCIVRKVAFRPPKKGESYKIIVKDKHGRNKYVETAKQALKYGGDIKVEPVLLDPRRANMPHLKIIMAPVDGFIVKSKSGNSLVCGLWKNQWPHLKTSKRFANKVAIFSQPNSADIGHFMQPFFASSFQEMANSIGVDLYGFDYSGYGRSGGTPTEQNIYFDIHSVFDEIVKRRGPNIEILLIGFSIGTTAVIDLASKKPKNLFGVVLIAPFTSGVRLLKDNPRLEKTPWYDCFQSYSKIQNVEVPVLVCHGTEDAMIPLKHGQVLHERSPYKIDPVIVDGANHVSILQDHNVHFAIRLFIATKRLERTPSVLTALNPVRIRDVGSSCFSNLEEEQPPCNKKEEMLMFNELKNKEM